MGGNCEGNWLNGVQSTDRVCACLRACVCVFKIFSVFKELLDLRLSSTKPAALALLKAAQTDCPSVRRGRSAVLPVLTKMLRCSRSSKSLFRASRCCYPIQINQPQTFLQSSTSYLSILCICIKIPPSLLQGATSTASYYYSQKDERAKYRNYSNVLFTVDPLFNISQSYRPFSFSFALPLLLLSLPVLFVPVTFDLFLCFFVRFVTATYCPLEPPKQSHNCIQHLLPVHSDTPLYAHSPISQ
jgi:hypothetical protein